jgi:hypothetical protein
MAITEPASYRNMMRYVESRLIPDINAKKERGEVFTPLSLISGDGNGMLDHLPNQVWSNPDLKWLDPANGIGNFPICVYYRLMEGLKSKIPKPQDRSRHIIENMLYMVELDPTNVSVSRSIFCEREDGVEINGNISQQDFLGEALPRDWPRVFDVIMGNPPYQSPPSNKTGQGGHSAGKGTLWDKFIMDSFKILKTNGYLCFINPPNWRRPGHKLWDILSHKQIIFLKIFAQKDGQTYFKSSTRFDMYIIENVDKYKDTYLIDQLDNTFNLDLLQWPFLPSYDYDIISKIITNKSLAVIYDTFYHTSKNMKKTVKTKNAEYKYPVVHSINQGGLGFEYVNDNTKGHFGVPKVILNFNQKQYSYPEQNDYDGKYGMSQISFGLPISSREEGDEILRAIDTEVFKTIIKATKWGAFQTDYRMFKYFKPDWYKIILEKNLSSV